MNFLHEDSHCEELVEVDHGAQSGGGVAGELEEFNLRISVGVPYLQLDHEPIQLGERQRIRTLMLDGILRGKNPEGLGKKTRVAVHRDTVLLHSLQKRALRLRRSTVYLIGEDDVGEDRPRQKIEAPTSLIIDIQPCDIGRKEVGGKLYAPEFALYGLRQAPREQRLSDTRDTFYGDMASGEHRHERKKNFMLLAGDGPLDVGDYLPHLPGHAGVVHVGLFPRVLRGPHQDFSTSTAWTMMRSE